MTTMIPPRALALYAALSLSFGCIAELDTDEDDAVAIGQSSEALQNATNTTGFAPVVRIENSAGGRCTATAIAHDLLITASHCLKSGNNVRDWIKVIKAHGANSAAEDAKSSYFIMSQDIYDNYNVQTSNGSSYYKRDFAFVKFGPDTFDAYYSTGTVTSSITGQTVRMVGFGGNSTKSYGDDVVTQTVFSSDYVYIRTDQNAGPNTENGDSGGPLLVSGGTGGYTVLGVLYGSGIYPVISQAMNDDIIEVLDEELPEYCTDMFKHINYDGDSWSFCHRPWLTTKLAGFSDPFKVESHWKYSDWNDEIGSLHLPTDGQVLTLFKDSSQGGDNLTFQTVYPFGNGASVSSLGDYGMNNKASSFYLSKLTPTTTQSWTFELTKTDKCLDVSGGNTANGTNIQQWSCSDRSAVLFKLVAVGAYYQIVHAASGKCLDVSSYGTSNGSNIHLWACHGGDNQLFSLYSNTTTSDVRDFKIKGKQSNKCLDLAGGNSSNGTNIQLWSCSSSNANQNFALNRYY